MRIAVVFGGKSTEHEVSQLSARNIYLGLKEAGHEAVFLGISKEGVFVPAFSLNEDSVLSKNWERLALESFVISDKNKEKLVCSEDAKDSLVFNPKLELFRLCGGEVDLVFLACHGNNCEDGNLQGFLELCDVPYTGADVLGSAIGMDKRFCKSIAEMNSIPILPYLEISESEFENNTESIIDEILNKFNMPIFIKPTRGGSSVGTTVIHSEFELKEKIAECFSYDSKLIIEPFWDKVREIEVAVLGNDEISVASPGEIIKAESVDYYDYKTKYLDSETSSLALPANLLPHEIEQIKKYAATIFKALQCSGYARVDFFMNSKTSEIAFNEINTLPGFTEISLFAKAFVNEGYSMPSLLNRIIELAIDNYSNKKHVFIRG